MSGSKPYHHGNLRSTLLDASLVLIRDEGLDRFSLRQLAAKSGVSHTAAYRHFRDKDQLLLALAESILKRTADRILYHSLKGLKPQECLSLGALACLRYWLERPDEFRILTTLGPTAATLPNPALDALQTLATACRFHKTTPASVALLLWSQLHGIAELAIRRQAGFQSRKQTLDFASASLRLLIPSLH